MMASQAQLDKLRRQKEQQAAEQKRQADEAEKKKKDARLYEVENKEPLLCEMARKEMLIKDQQAKIAELEKKATRVEELETKNIDTMSMEALQLKLDELKAMLAEAQSSVLSPVERARQDVDRDLLQKINQNFGPKDVIVDSYDLDITQEKIAVLKDLQWLNSEVITWWLEWWREQTGGGSQKVMPTGMEGVGKNWFANTYFYTKLMEDGTYNYKNVRRWTKKINIFECDRMIIPINDMNMHWYMACINFKEKRTEVYDSMGDGRRQAVHANLMRWLKDEHQDKRNEPLPEGWTAWYPMDNGVEVPKQHNGNDCGVFCCMFCAGLSLGRVPFDFKQTDIPIIRRWMVQVMYKEGERLGNCAHPGLCSV